MTDRRLRFLVWLARRFGYQATISGLGLTITRPVTTDDFLRALRELPRGKVD